MGEAKRRGTFEERKALAISEGRSKEKESAPRFRNYRSFVDPETALMLAPVLMAASMRKKLRHLPEAT